MPADTTPNDERASRRNPCSRDEGVESRRTPVFEVSVIGTRRYNTKPRTDSAYGTPHPFFEL